MSAGRPRKKFPEMRLPQWMHYRERVKRYFYYGPDPDGIKKQRYISLGRCDLEEARKAYAKIIIRLNEVRGEPDRKQRPPRLGGAANKPGIIYIIRAGRDGPFKIGYTKDRFSLSSRVSELQTGCPYPIRVHGHVEGVMADEHDAHVALTKWRSSGEWFHPTPQVLEYINKMLKKISSCLVESDEFDDIVLTPETT